MKFRYQQISERVAIQIGSASFVAVAYKSDRTTTVVDSVLYKYSWSTQKFESFQTFGTDGAEDVISVQMWKGTRVLAFANSLGTITELTAQALDHELIGTNSLSTCDAMFSVWRPIPPTGASSVPQHGLFPRTRHDITCRFDTQAFILDGHMACHAQDIAAWETRGVPNRRVLPATSATSKHMLYRTAPGLQPRWIMIWSPPT
jgi:hypothetical protein